MSSGKCHQESNCGLSSVRSAGWREQGKTLASLLSDPSLTRTVELKLMDYYNHLVTTIQLFATLKEALLDRKRRVRPLGLMCR
jgi:hypothetical protein